MRFQIREHKALIKVLKEEGFSEDEVLFVKKRGRLHVQVPDKKGSFYFFRKRTMKLNEKGQFVPQVEYLINESKDPRSWPDVLERFVDWLRN